MSKKIVLSGVSGNLGSLVARNLLTKGIAPASIRGLTRNPAKALVEKSWLAESGINLVRADYDEPDSLPAAFAGATEVLFVSSPVLDTARRLRQHANVVEAAKQAGVAHISYTSFAGIDTAQLGLEIIHRETERLIVASGLAYTFLRNAFYLEMVGHPALLRQTLATGELVSVTSAGKMNFVARQDLALAAASIVAAPGSLHHNRVYELVNPQPFSYSDLARAISEVAGKTVIHRSVAPEVAIQALAQAGLPAGVAGFLVRQVQTAVETGQFSATSPDLANLLQGSYTSLTAAVRQAL